MDYKIIYVCGTGYVVEYKNGYYCLSVLEKDGYAGPHLTAESVLRFNPYFDIPTKPIPKDHKSILDNRIKQIAKDMRNKK